jgi:hypothetical protein
VIPDKWVRVYMMSGSNYKLEYSSWEIIREAFEESHRRVTVLDRTGNVYIIRVDLIEAIELCTKAGMIKYWQDVVEQSQLEKEFNPEGLE